MGRQPQRELRGSAARQPPPERQRRAADEHPQSIIQKHPMAKPANSSSLRARHGRSRQEGPG
eukprot:15482170-Alexandrium_andersonii.AAC.1